MMPFAIALLLAAGPLVGPEERIGGLRIPNDVALAVAGDTMLLAWNEGGRIRARAGSTTRDLGNGTSVAVASDGSDFLIVWQQPTRVAGARWSHPSDVKTYIPAANNTAPVVVWDGARFQVFGGFDSIDAAAALNGIVLAASSRLQPEGYRCVPVGLSLYCSIHPARYTLEWRILGTTPPVFSAIYNGLASSYPPGVGAGKDGFLMAWRGATSIEVRHLRTDGSTSGFANVPIARPLTGRRAPQIAWDGARYLIVFDSFDASGDIWGAAIVPGDGYVAEPFLIAGGAENELAPAVAALGKDQFVVAYTIGNDAVGTRVVSFREPPSRRRPSR